MEMPRNLPKEKERNLIAGTLERFDDRD